MQEIKIPEGCKASIDFEKRVVVIEKGEFKKGDILYDRNGTGWSWVAIYDSYSRNNTSNPIKCSAILNIHDGEMRYNYNVTKDNFRLATPSEAQLLFDALAKEGKKWNAETLQIEDIEKDILVPESIGIYKDYTIFNKRYGDGLFIGFNKDKQALGVDVVDGVYVVDSTGILEQTDKVQCKLTPCKREYLKVGDTAFISETFRLDDNMLSDKGRYVKIIGNTTVKINKIGEVIYDRTFNNHWYKVEPINK